MNVPVVCTPLRTEYLAVRRPLMRGGLHVVRTGMGPDRSAAAARLLKGHASAVVVAGVAGSLVADVRPGEVVVATEVFDASSSQRLSCQAAELLAGAVRGCGFVAHLGPVVSTPRLGGERTRRELATTDAIAADMESAYLAELASGVGYAVLRVIVDTPDAPLFRPGTIPRGLAALRTLRACAPAIAQWVAGEPSHVPAGEPPAEQQQSSDVSCSGASGNERAAWREVT